MRHRLVSSIAAASLMLLGGAARADVANDPCETGQEGDPCVLDDGGDGHCRGPEDDGSGPLSCQEGPEDSPDEEGDDDGCAIRGGGSRLGMATFLVAAAAVAVRHSRRRPMR